MTDTKFHYEGKLETTRLRTRFLTTDDIGTWAEFFEDEEAIAYFSMAVYETHQESARHWIERQLNRYAQQRYGMQALIHKKTGAFVGMCGLMTQTVDGKTELEVGYHVLKKYWGKSYATEAAKAFIDYAFEHDLSDSVISIIDLGNTNSQRVAEKNGLTLVKQTTYDSLDVNIFRICKEKWSSKAS